MMTGDTTTTTSMTSAEELIREVASRIGMECLDVTDEVCKNMKKEYILEEWQLSALDSFQWQQLGAPIGLAAAIRKISSVNFEPEMATAPHTRAQKRTSVQTRTSVVSDLPSVLTSKVCDETANGMSTTRTNWATLADSVMAAKKNSRTSARYATAPKDFEDIDEEQAEEQEGEEQFENETFSGEPPHCVFSFSKSLKEFPDQKMFNRSFPMTQTFQQALLHSKSGADLKGHTVFVMELSVLTSALFLGAAVELWGAFPMDAVADGPNEAGDPFVPRQVALVFHFFSFTSLIMQLLCTSGWIWTLHATAAVSPRKFHKFLVQTRYPLDNFLKFSEFGHFVFTANICLLFGAMIASTTTNTILKLMGLFLPWILMIPGGVLVHNFSSYIGRVAFHGLLLTDNELSDVCYTPDADGCAIKAERDIANSFKCENVLSVDKALDVYHLCTTQPNDGQHLPSVFDAIFPVNDKKEQKQEPVKPKNK